MFIPLVIMLMSSPPQVKPAARATPHVVSAKTCTAILERAGVVGTINPEDLNQRASYRGAIIAAAIQGHLDDPDIVAYQVKLAGSAGAKNAAFLVAQNRGMLDISGLPGTKEKPGLQGCFEQYK
jgi:hypothetical protein